jgi:OFA family oxalate/formate antiporter-like MFS transporter
MEPIKNRGWQVTLAGLGINLALGILYTWSIFRLAIKESIDSGKGAFNWDIAALNDPYAVCCLTFAFTMILAGRIQDRLTPRITAIIGGILTGTGLMLVSLSSSLSVWILGFGVLTGAGLGFGYASATPPAIKWFPAARTGMIAGIVVAGFGLASVYIAPLANFLISRFGIHQAMLVFGLSFLVVVCGLAMMLVNPPRGYVPPSKVKAVKGAPVNKAVSENFSPSEMMNTGAFYKLWFMFFAGSGAGLIIIGSVAGMARQSMGQLAWVVVALMAIGNAGGRVIAGILSDRIGRTRTLLLTMTFQAGIILSLLAIDGTQALLLVIAATLIGFNYGTNLSLFPSATKDYYGLKNFGVNYGLVFSAWGAAGFILPRVSQMIVAYTGSAQTSYIMAAVLLIVSAVMSVSTKAPEKDTSAPVYASGLAYSGFRIHAGP